MRILVLSDIHANPFALEAVFADVKGHYDAIWFLGDLVGYGANPIETYEKIKQACNHDGKYHVWLGGNHEKTLHSKVNIEDISKTEQVDRRHLNELFASLAEAETHFANIISKENERKEIPIDEWLFFLVHSSYADPNNDDRYLYPWLEDKFFINLFIEEFRALSGNSLQSRCMLYGHTHVPALIRAQQKTDGSIELEAKKVIPFVRYTLDKGNSWFINPGSVGLPSDKDTRASYAIIDLDPKGTDAITFCRVRYEINDALMAMKSKGYDFIHFAQKYRDRLINATPHPKTPKSWLEHYELVKRTEKTREP